MDAHILLQEAADHFDDIRSTYRTLHQMPGTGFDLADTLAFVRQELQALDLTPMDCGKAGLTTLVGGKRPGRVFLLRADMDALPIREQSGLDYAATNGRMHACGHDMHTAMLLGAARLLKAHEEEIQGTVKLMFQPAEESLEGAKDMIAAGVLENPRVDAAAMLHVMAALPYPSGTLLVSAPGVSAPAADFFDIRIQGKGCHGSMPHTGIDPLTAAAHLLIGLQTIHARELAMCDRAALTIGTMNAGTAANVISDAVTMSGTLRSFNEDTRAFIKQRLRDMAENTARSFRCEATVTFTSGCPALNNDEDLSREALAYADELLGADMAQSISAEGGGGGSEDFAYVTQEVPSLMLMLCAGHPEQGYSHPQHHPMVRFDESVLSTGSAVYAWLALRWLEGHA